MAIFRYVYFYQIYVHLVHVFYDYTTYTFFNLSALNSGDTSAETYANNNKNSQKHYVNKIKHILKLILQVNWVSLPMHRKK